MNQTILYVDVENLQEAAREAITETINKWPEELPKPAVLKLYVKADLAELWKMWSSVNIHSIEVQIKGVQHYTGTGYKNSADIALVLDAMADVFKGRTKYVAILSDDSDFATLFTTIKLETCSPESPKVPFKWFMTNRSDTISSTLTDLFPSEYIQTVICSKPTVAPKNTKSTPSTPTPVKKTPAPTLPKPKKPAPTENKPPDGEAIAKVIIKNIKVGSFKSAECAKLVKQHFPNHPMAKLDSARFGTLFSKDIWPVLGKYGVLLPNPNHKPRKYEMTEEAKKKVG